MDSTRTKILTVVGVSLGTTLIAWVVYQSLFKKPLKKRKKSIDKKPVEDTQDNSIQGKTTHQPNEPSQNADTQISPPFEFSMKANFPDDEDVPEADRSHEIMPGAENSFIEDEGPELSVDRFVIEEDIIAPHSVETALSAPPVVINLDDTVTLNSSDLSSDAGSQTGVDDTFPDDSDIIMLDDSDITELLIGHAQKESNAQESDVAGDAKTEECSFDSDIIEVPIVLKNESPMTYALPPNGIEDVPSKDLKDETDNTSVTEPAVVHEEVVIQSDSVTQLNASLDEIEKNMATHSQPCAVQEEVTQQKVTLQESENSGVSASMDDSRNSDDSVNGCESVTTDSGIVLSTNAPIISRNIEGDESLQKESERTSQPTADVKPPNGNHQALSPNSNGIPINSATDSETKLSCGGGSVSDSKTAEPVLVNEKPTSTEQVQVEIKTSPTKPLETKLPTSPKEHKVTSPGAEKKPSIVSPSAATENGSASGSQLKKTVYKFLIPETLCGLFIGKSGRNISALKQETNTNIKIGREPVLSTFRYCTVEGNERNVQRALRAIKKRYPDVDTTSVDQLGISTAGLTLSSDRMQLHLPMGVLIDVVVSNCVNAGHIFVQQPTHPTFNSWQRLDDCMNSCYGDGATSPPLPTNIDDSILCVAPMNGRWYRAQVMSFSEDRYQCEIKLMDMGGYASVQTDLLRQIREDFLSLPFQAVECYLANVEPLDGVAYSAEATDALLAMTSGQVVQCQPAAVAENNVPYIHVLAQRDHQAYVVNRELANQGLVKWYNMSE